MCQSDPFVIEEYRNPLIEFSSLIFAQNNVKTSEQYLKLTEDSQSIYIQLLLYWTSIVNDSKSSSISHLIFSHSLNNLKSMLLSSGKKMFKISLLNIFRNIYIAWYYLYHFVNQSFFYQENFLK